MLCERFGVSRTPLREALKVLAAEGSLQLMPRRGAAVPRITPEEIEEVFPVMAVLEGLAGELACKLATDEQIAQVQALHEQMMQHYRNNDEPAYLSANRAIHEAIFELAGNATLTSLYQQLLTRIRSFRFTARKRPAHWKSAIEEHQRMMEALAKRDGRQLSRLLAKHVLGTTVNIAKASLEKA
jgi:DNA-binding GntR family transcriptional regulator